MPVRPTLLTPFLAVALLAPDVAAQQPVDRWKIDVEFGLNGASGNSSYSILRTGTKVTLLQKESMEFEASGLVRYGKNDEKVIADDARASLKLDIWPKDTWSPFFFMDWSRDKIRRLDTRASGGAGAKFLFWSGASGKASLSAAALFDYQNFLVEPGSGNPESESRARWSLRHKLEKKLSETATFEHVLFYQPLWNSASDYLLDVTHTVTTKLLSRLSLALEHQYLRDSSPQPGVRSDDQKFSVILKMSF